MAHKLVPAIQEEIEKALANVLIPAESSQNFFFSSPVTFEPSSLLYELEKRGFKVERSELVKYFEAIAEIINQNNPNLNLTVFVEDEKINIGAYFKITPETISAAIQKVFLKD